jgi:dihydrofolate synthase/folylpolyglutamate synthase
LSVKPLLIIDSAHNNDSIRKLVNTIKLVFPNKEIILIFGASEDKDVVGMINILISKVHSIITTQSNHPRALDAEIVLAIVQKQGEIGTSIPSIEDALKFALENWTEKSVIIATGSIFIAAAIRELWISTYQNKINK